MRAILLGDVLAAARVLSGTRPQRRAWVLRRMIAEACWAAKRRASGQIVPLGRGDGTLMAAALRRRPGPEPFLSEPGYAACIIAVLEAVTPGLSAGAGHAKRDGGV